MAVKPIPYSPEDLFGRGPQREFTGESLSEIAFPLGGIGTGTVSLSGRGGLKDWEVFNRPNKGSLMPFSFFTLYTKVEGAGSPVVKVLEAPPAPPYTGSGEGAFSAAGFGVARETGAGLPHVDSCSFRGEYPFAYVKFRDRDLPVQVSLEAFNPFIPLNDIDSGIPVAVLIYTLVNLGRVAVDARLAANLFNAVGYPGTGRFQGDFLGGNVTRVAGSSLVHGLFMTSEKYAAESPRFGSLALVTPWKDVACHGHWLRSGWHDSLQAFWDEFSRAGALEDRDYGPSEDGESDVGSIVLQARVEPGNRVRLPVYIAWHFPNFQKYWASCAGETPREDMVWKNFYAARFRDALDVADYVAANSERLYGETRLFHDALFDSTLPPYVLDAASSQASVIRTTTCIRLEDGTFYGFEGSRPDGGCCEGSCTHVWNYAAALAFLFPSLERTMLDADYRYNQFEDGKMCFRLQLPLGSPRWDFHAAADGQMGTVIRVYRNWKLSGDDRWLEGVWPKARKALEHAWAEWDKDRDGVMEGLQHNTYDIEFVGPNTMTGGWYLGALRAAEEIAAHLGDRETAAEYRALLDSGSRWADENLFNGDYYVQQCEPEKAAKYQYGQGCLSDQLVGQWACMAAGLGYLFKKENVRKALEAVFRYNWRNGFKDHATCQRVFATGDDNGLLLCTWPRGGRPAFPFVYCDEVWCGVEYQVASHLVSEGFIEEGLSVVRAVRERHDGRKRNPWNEFECGSHYARSMASWALLTTLAGFWFDAPQRRIGFAPRLSGRDFRVFWSTGSGWGSYSQKVSLEGTRVALEVGYGRLELEELALGRLFGPAGRVAAVTVGARPVAVATLVKGPDGAPGVSVRFAGGGVEIKAGERLELLLQ